MQDNDPNADNELDQSEVEDVSAETSGEEEQQEEQPQKEQPLTAEDYRKIAREEALRVAQSQVAKGENRIQAYIQQQIAALQQTSKLLGLNDQQVQAAQDKIIREAYANPQVNGAGQFQEAPQYQQQEVHPTVEAAISMMEARGVIVEEGDPEFDGMIKPLLASGNYRDLIRVTNEAMAAKEARIQSRKSKAAVRTPGGTGGQSDNNTDLSKYTVNDSKELYKLGARQAQNGGNRR